MDNRIIAIHQPNFLPWLGYFNKIYRSKTFIILDNVEYPKSGSGYGSWVNRVKILVQGRGFWITCPIHRVHGSIKIKDVCINDDVQWRKRILKTIEYNYRKAYCFDECWDFIKDLIEYRCEKLADYNIRNIQKLLEKVGLEREVRRQSAMSVNCSATELLIDIVKTVGGSSYLCGHGAAGYQKDELFEQGGVDLIYQNYRHPTYTQSVVGDFIPGMSIVDVIMNCGFEKTRTMIFG